MRPLGLVLTVCLLAIMAGPAAADPRASADQPPIARWFIPFPEKRKQEMAAYSRRHYGIDSYRLVDPKVIIEHVAVTRTARAVYNTFAIDRPDVGLHELPQVCAHYVVDRDGTIYQLVSLRLMCRHAIGMNYTAIGIEHVGMTDGDVLSHKRQLRASWALTTWLRCHYGIPIGDVIGHNEIRSSRYHRERVAKIRNDVHSDMRPATMRRYRAALARRSCVG